MAWASASGVELQDEVATFGERQSQLTAVKLYLQSVIWGCELRWQNIHNGITNHLTLLDSIRHWRTRTGNNEHVWLVTFNYDLMLENALLRLGLEINSLDDYVRGNSFRLAKLHGSVNWGRELDTTMAKVMKVPVWGLVDELIDRAQELKISSRYRLAPTGEGRPFVRLGQGQGSALPLFPAIAIPVEAKRDYECPAEHLDALAVDLPKVDKVVTIGWRGTELPFLDMLKQRLTKTVRLLVVAGGRAEANEVVLDSCWRAFRLWRRPPTMVSAASSFGERWTRFSPMASAWRRPGTGRSSATTRLPSRPA